MVGFRVKRRGRESNPRIEVLQTSALPLGYPAGERISSIAFNSSVSTCKEKEFEESKELQEFRMRELTLPCLGETPISLSIPASKCDSRSSRR